mgnify:CR=1 FL=1
MTLFDGKLLAKVISDGDEPDQLMCTHLLLEALEQPRYDRALSAREVSHRRVAARLADTNHSLVVLVAHDLVEAGEQNLPEEEARQATVSQSVAHAGEL